jgi:hypothetical protein
MMGKSIPLEKARSFGLRNLAPFAIGKVVKKLNRIRVRIHNEYNRTFPKPEFFGCQNIPTGIGASRFIRMAGLRVGFPGLSPP